MPGETVGGGRQTVSVESPYGDLAEIAQPYLTKLASYLKKQKHIRQRNFSHIYFMRQ